MVLSPGLRSVNWLGSGSSVIGSTRSRKPHECCSVDGVEPAFYSGPREWVLRGSFVATMDHAQIITFLFKP